MPWHISTNYSTNTDHLLPTNDSLPHILSSTCDCLPYTLKKFPNILIHRSFDHREFYEPDYDPKLFTNPPPPN